MNTICYILLVTIAIATNLSGELINFEENPQAFIIENKEIVIPGFPGAFNASVVRWQEKLLLCFRIRRDMVSTFEIGLVWLDNNFNPTGKACVLDIRNDNPQCKLQKQDPRLIVLHEKLYILYSDFITLDTIPIRRMFIAELQQDDHGFFISNPLCLHPFEGCSNRWEKNWVPFIYNNKLLLAYSLTPHRIFQPLLTSGECITHSITNSLTDWKWGELRGGTPAIQDGNEYIAFFHSSTLLATAHSSGKKMTHYVMGAYTFSAQPPFEITHISPSPIAGEKFYSGAPNYVTWKPLRVVFPMGIIVDEDYIWVTYGKQDFEIWVTKIDKKLLKESLVPCYHIPLKETPSYDTLLEHDDNYIVLYDQS